MKVTIELPCALRIFANQQPTIEIQADTVGKAFATLIEQYPDMHIHLYDYNEHFRESVVVYLDGKDVRYNHGLGTPIEEGAVISIVPIIAGG